jgi:hypothetical protein
VQLARRGGTDLVGEYSWRAVDTLSVHIDLLLDSQEIPIGWGAAEQRRLPQARRGEHGGSLRRNPRASRLALQSMQPREGYRGVPEIRDVINASRQDDRRLVYSVGLSLPGRVIDTSDRLLVPAGLTLADGTVHSLAPVLAGDALHALASAEVHFQRPVARSDGRVEYPNLFSPYWQARLTSTPRATRMLTAPQRGLSVDPFAVLP